MEVGLPTNMRRAQSGQVACSGARRQNKALDEVSAAILGGVAAENASRNRRICSERSERKMRPS